jgi:hypothetical protein
MRATVRTCVKAPVSTELLTSYTHYSRRYSLGDARAAVRSAPSRGISSSHDKSTATHGSAETRKRGSATRQWPSSGDGQPTRADGRGAAQREGNSECSADSICAEARLTAFRLSARRLCSACRRVRGGPAGWPTNDDAYSSVPEDPPICFYLPTRTPMTSEMADVTKARTPRNIGEHGR